MEIFNKVLWYLKEYIFLFSLSFFYFVALAWCGYFLILRRSVVLGITLTNLAQFSFVLGASLYTYFVGDIIELIIHSHTPEHLTEHIAESGNHKLSFLKLDIFILPIFFLGLFIITYFINKNFISNLSKAHPEIILAYIFIFLSGLSHLTYKLFGTTDLVISKAYFTELLYTPPELLSYYLKSIIPLLLLFILLYKTFLLISFDTIQARLLKIPYKFYNFIFYLIIGVGIVLGMRVFGFYLSLAVLFIPPYVSLSIFNKKNLSFYMSGVLAIFFVSIGILVSLVFDYLPTEPVLIVVIGILGLFTKIFFNKN